MFKVTNDILKYLVVNDLKSRLRSGINVKIDYRRIIINEDNIIIHFSYGRRRKKVIYREDKLNKLLSEYLLEQNINMFLNND